MPRVLLEKITQPSRLEPLSVTGPQGHLGFQYYQIICSSTVKDGSRDAYTVHGIIFKSSIQFSHSVLSDSLWPMDCSTPGLPVHHQLLEFTQTHVHWVCDAIQPSHPLLSPFAPALNLSQHQDLFKGVNSLHQVAKVLEFQLQHQSFQWTPGLTSFRMDWLDLPAVQRTLRSLLQHHSSEASILQCSAFFTIQLSHPYMTSGKTIALTRRTFVGKVMSLFFNMLSRFVIAVLPRSKNIFMAAITICSDFGAPQNSQPLFPLFPHLFLMKWWDQMPWS